MPTRMIRESILVSDNFNAMPVDAQMFVIRLIVKVDDHGRFDARPQVLRSLLYPINQDQVSLSDITRMLRDSERYEMISLYSIDGKPYLEFRQWEKYQRLRQNASKYPNPPQVAADCGKSPQVAADCGLRACAAARAQPSEPEPEPYTYPSLSQDEREGGVGGTASGSPTPQETASPDKDVGEEPEGKPPAPPKPRGPDPPPWAMELAVEMDRRLLELFPNRIRPSPAHLRQWAADLDKLHRLDGRPVAEIVRVTRMALADEFWQRNAQSGKAIREHWNRIITTRADGGRGNGNGQADGRRGGNPVIGAGHGIRQAEVDEQARRRQAMREARSRAAAAGAPGADVAGGAGGIRAAPAREGAGGA